MKFKIDKIFDYSATASGLVLLFLAVLTFCDVFGRRFLNSPVTGEFKNLLPKTSAKVSRARESSTKPDAEAE